MKKNHLGEIGLVIGIILLFAEICIIPAIAQDAKNTPFVSMTQTMTSISSPFRDETELKYYIEQNLSVPIGIPAGGPVTWQSAIRLTQMEIAPYMNWTITKVNVAFNGESNTKSIDIRIYIYDNGDPTHPGTIIVNDSTYTLDTTGVTTISLVTSVNLSGHDELWIAVEWYQFQSQPNQNYAWMDTLSGPAVDGKGDWWFTGSSWAEMQWGGGYYDGNWGISAIVEGEGVTEIAIGDISGPLGVATNVSNIGSDNAIDVNWSILLAGGLFKHINMTTTGTTALLAVRESLPIQSRMAFGFGKITIVITAKAKNTLQISTMRNAFLFGPFVLRIT